MTGHQGAVLLAWGRDAYRGIPASFGPGLDVLKGDDHALVVVSAASLVASPYAELRCDDELVQAALRLVEVEEADGARVPAPRPVHGQGHPVGQVFVDRLVAGACARADTVIDNRFYVVFFPVVRKSHTCSFKKEATSPSRQETTQNA